MAEPDQAPSHQTGAETAAVALLAAYFGSRDAVAAAVLPDRLVAALVALGLRRRAVVAAGRLAMAPPLTGRNRHGSPTVQSGATTSLVRQVKADEPAARAQYVLAAAQRLTKALDATNTASAGMDVFAAAVRLEAGYMSQQRQAGQNRAKAASALDRVFAEAGPNGKWQWVAQMDGSTTADCRALNGTLHPVGETANGLIPGSVHPQCRCTARPVTDTFSRQPLVFPTP